MSSELIIIEIGIMPSIKSEPEKYYRPPYPESGDFVYSPEIYVQYLTHDSKTYRSAYLQEIRR